MIKFAEVSVLNQEILDTVSLILESGQFIQGSWNKRFNREWAEYCGTKYSVRVASGSAALISCLKYLKQKYDRNIVICPSYSFAATVFSIIEAGCKPVYCPVSIEGLMEFEFLKLVTAWDEILCILPVHLYGQKLEIPKKWFDRLPIVEDACQAHGAIKSIKSTAACFSFFPAKNLGCAGDGGAVVTNDDELANWVSAYTNYGDFPGEKYVHSVAGNNLRLDNLQASILSLKLNNLDGENRRRRELLQRYIHNGIWPVTNLNPNVFHHFPILVEDRNYFLRMMKQEKIEVGCHYSYTLFDIVPSASIYETGDKAKVLAECVVTLPISPHLEFEEIDLISKIIKSAYTKNKQIWERL